MKRMAIMLTLALFCSSCGTIFCGSKKKITFDSSVKQPVRLVVDGRIYEDVTFPFKAKVKRGFNESMARAELPNYKPCTIYIDKTFNAVSVINLLDVLAWGIDAATGAMMKPEFDYYEFNFKPLDEKTAENK